MLPVTHGSRYTRLQIVLYTLVLVAVTLLPFAIRMSGMLYLVGGAGAGRRVPRLRVRRCTATTATRWRGATFRYSIVYLAALFSALLVDHYWR